METPIAASVAAVSAYLAGSVPFGLLTAKLVAGIDIRQQGSGNIGATNVGRVVGAKWGAFVLVLDCLKGSLSVCFLPPLLAAASEPSFVHLRVICGVAAIVGHMFPCWLGFRGGKGVATALGVVLVLAPWGTLTAVLVFLGVFGAFRIVSLSSMLAAIAFAVFQQVWLWPQSFSKENWSLTAFSVSVPLLIIIRHRSNIARLIRGDEPPFSK